MTTERVLRFEVPGPGALDRIASDPTPGGLRCGPAELDFFRDVYFDTPAGDLERRGVTVCMRIRASDGSTLTVEVRDPEGGAPHRRAVADLPGTDPGEAFRSDTEPAHLLRALVDPARLAPRLELATVRRTRSLELDGARGARALLACEATTARSGQEAAELFELELRFPDTAAPEADDAVRDLAAEFLLRPTREERMERARILLAGADTPRDDAPRPHGGPADNGQILTALHTAMRAGIDAFGRGKTRRRSRRSASPTGSGAVVEDLPPGSLLNMELSTLAFNRRVLVLAEDPRTPPLERVRFVSIFGANLDEFFRVRVAGFKQQVAAGSTKHTMDGATPQVQLDVMRTRARELSGQAYTLLRGLLPELARHGIRISRVSDLVEGDRVFLHRYYREEIHPLLAPLPVGPGYPFPHIRNLRPALAVLVRDPGEGEERFSVIELPGELPRLVPLPDRERFVPVEEVICTHLGEVYPGMEVRYAYLFRVTRSAELHLPKDQDVANLLRTVEEELARRPFRPVVRLEVESAMPPEIRDLLLCELRYEARGENAVLDEEDVYPVDGLVDLRALREIAGLPRPELHYPPFESRVAIDTSRPVVEAIQEREVLVHFPYDSFECSVERFLLEAAEDPEVVSIRLALYRTNFASRIVEALRRASETGKEVAALVELTARFDEQRNVEWARYLQAEGIRVVYGVPGQKIHAKVALVTRREEGELRRYVYIGTGNLNAATAAAYTDLGLLSMDPGLGAEVHDLFETLTAAAGEPRFRHLLVAPFNMRERFVEMIEREAEHARTGRGGHIRAKINGLADREMIAALYRASRAGVRTELIVRGICALRPGIPGLSENIRVISILGRFLEHARIFHFANAANPEYYIGSADWRTRNLSTRVEVATPVEDRRHRECLDRILDTQLADPDAWELGSDGSYYRRPETAPHAANAPTGATR
ncbi:MAG TPA: polyphosphate kinase 1 [Longimicrobiaceae bacterium]|nr:polyphosphate kinase 1 [Longimicrobiaceae bacterium]